MSFWRCSAILFSGKKISRGIEKDVLPIAASHFLPTAAFYLPKNVSQVMEKVLQLSENIL